MATSISQRADVRAAAPARPWPRALGVPSVALAVTVVAILVLSHTSVFRARTVEVVGGSTLSKREIVRLAGVDGSTNVPWLNEGAAARRLESSPWIAEATVSARLPWTIRIVVVERHPVAVAGTGARAVLVAEDGVILGPAANQSGLPVIEVDPARVSATSYAAPAEAIAGLDRGNRPLAVRAVVTAEGRLHVDLAAGTRIDFGGPGRIQAKAAAALRIFRWARATGTTLASINVTAPDAPAATAG